MTVWLCISVAVLAFLFGVGGLYLQKLLPEPHSVDLSRDMIGAIVGLVSLLLALVFGTLIGSAYSFYATQRIGTGDARRARGSTRPRASRIRAGDEGGARRDEADARRRSRHAVGRRRG